MLNFTMLPSLQGWKKNLSSWSKKKPSSTRSCKPPPSTPSSSKRSKEKSRTPSKTRIRLSRISNTASTTQRKPTMTRSGSMKPNWFNLAYRPKNSASRPYKQLPAPCQQASSHLDSSLISSTFSSAINFSYANVY